MGIHTRPVLAPMIGDVDDHRPRTRWAVVTSPDVAGLAGIVEDIAPGDRIPLHTHPEEEVLFIASGAARVRVGDDEQDVGAGAVVLVPANTAHGTRNTSADVVRVYAAFPATSIGIAYLERNPAPGTEADAPRPAYTVDLRSGW